MEEYPLRDRGVSVDSWTRFRKPERLAWALVYLANDGKEQPLRWIRRLYKYGVTESLLTDLARLVQDIRIDGYLELNPTSKMFEWLVDLDMESIAEDENWFALCVVWLVNGGAVDKLKRCALSDCGNYFIGGPRAKWCSDNCGSKYRIRKKRKKDKERQML